MKLTEQVITPTQALKLREIGVIQQSTFWWSQNNFISNGDDAFKLFISIEPTNFPKDRYASPHEMSDPIKNVNCIAAFTVAELGIVLGQYTSRITLENSGNYLILEKGLTKAFFHACKTEAEARASLLIYLIENNIVTSDEVNTRLGAAGK